MAGRKNVHATTAAERLGARLRGVGARALHLGARLARRVGLSLALLVVILTGTLAQFAAAGLGLAPVASAQGRPSAGTPNRFNPKTAASSVSHPGLRQGTSAHAPAGPPQAISRGGPGPMRPGYLALQPGQTARFVGSDGRLEVDVPAGAVSAADVAAAGGGLSLRISQIAPASGSNAGGSGLVSFGTYLIQVVDARQVLHQQGLRQPVTLRLHYGKGASALDLSHAFVVYNGALPATLTTDDVAPTTASTAVVEMPRLHPGQPTVPEVSGAPATPVTPAGIGLGTSHSQNTALDVGQKTLTVMATLSNPSTSMSWNTDAPVATFGKPDPFNVDLNAGALSSSFPLDVPAGPGGLTPPVALSYSSEAVAEQHNPQGAAPWVGEGWNLSLGAISWAEHNVTSSCASTCDNTWEDSWQLSDPFGTASELIPPNINVSTYWDDTPNNYCGADGNANNATSYPCPIQWHTAPETHAKVFAYVGSLSLPDGAGAHPPCFRVFLPNGIMEEFGCTADSLEYYYAAGMGDYISSWNLDLITDPRGNQIHITYQQNGGSYWYGGYYHSYIMDAVPSTIEWDSPGCLNAQAMCTGSAWAPLMRVSFAASLTPARLTNTPGGCNTAAWLRCDDPDNLSPSGGIFPPEVQSVNVLNDVYVQVRSSGTASWNTLKDYQLSYQQNGPSTITDPSTGKQESAAGQLLLTKLVTVGDDGSTALPTRTFDYTSFTEYYEDDLFHPNPSTNCGPSWNTGNGGGCLLWSQSYGGNSYYLSSASNGMGLQQTFSWNDARNNTHGVNGGGSNTANPLYCNGLTGYPCNEADDQNWSHAVLTQQQGQVYRAASTGNVTVTSTSSFQYKLTYPLPAQECSDCVAGMYWGNQNDGDYLDYYNATFMGFAEADVTNPDGSVDVHKYDATEGYGLYDATVPCLSYTPPCRVAPWWDLTNAAHGHEIETDTYDTNGTTLLSKTTTQYQAICPPSGVGGTPAWSATVNGNPYTYTWDGKLVAELDHGNPVVVCDVQTSQTDDYTYNGQSSGPHTTTTYQYSRDGSGHLQSDVVTSTVNGGTDGSPTTSVKVQYYLWNDSVSATSTSATGTYILDLNYWAATQDTSGYAKNCLSTSFDGQWGLGQQNNVIHGEPTSRQTFTTACGSAANNWVSTGLLTTTTTYDGYGNVIGTTDADANAGVAGHTGCTAGGTAQSTCTTLDTVFDALPISTTNALNQTATTGYTSASGGGYGLWPTSTTDPNGQTTTFGYDALGRMTSKTLPGETSGDTTTSWSYTDWCSATGAQTPCVEIDQTQRLNSSTTVTSRAFYDGYGNLVETRAPGPGGQDVVRYRNYDPSGRDVFDSISYFVPAYTGGPGAAAFATPDTTQAGTTTTYTSRLQTQATDPLSNTTTTDLSTECGAYGDSGCYTQTTVYDALNHAQQSLADGLGRTAYTVRMSGNSSSTYQLYAKTSFGYDYNGNLVTITQPDGTHTTTFTYDLTSRMTGMSDPDRGTASYTYDADGNPITAVDARGSAGTVYAGYDGIDRQVWRNTTNSSTGAYVTYTYDNTANGNAGIGQLTGETFSGGPNNSLSGSYSVVYDARGQATSLTQTTTVGTPYTLGLAYNDAGQPTSLTYSDGEVFTPGYDASGWLTSAVTTPPGGSQINLLTNVGYSGVGARRGCPPAPASATASTPTAPATTPTCAWPAPATRAPAMARRCSAARAPMTRWATWRQSAPRCPPAPTTRRSATMSSTG